MFIICVAIAIGSLFRFSSWGLSLSRPSLSDAQKNLWLLCFTCCVIINNVSFDYQHDPVFWFSFSTFFFVLFKLKDGLKTFIVLLSAVVVPYLFLMTFIKQDFYLTLSIVFTFLLRAVYDGLCIWALSKDTDRTDKWFEKAKVKIQDSIPRRVPLLSPAEVRA